VWTSDRAKASCCSVSEIDDFTLTSSPLVPELLPSRICQKFSRWRYFQLRPVEDGPPLPSLAIHLGRTKTSGADQHEVVYLTGRPVEALNAWLDAANIDKGSIFRAIDR
jgi:hypothetical protein